MSMTKKLVFSICMLASFQNGVYAMEDNSEEEKQSALKKEIKILEKSYSDFQERLGGIYKEKTRKKFGQITDKKFNKKDLELYHNQLTSENEKLLYEMKKIEQKILLMQYKENRRGQIREHNIESFNNLAKTTNSEIAQAIQNIYPYSNKVIGGFNVVHNPAEVKSNDLFARFHSFSLSRTFKFMKKAILGTSFTKLQRAYNSAPWLPGSSSKNNKPHLDTSKIKNNPELMEKVTKIFHKTKFPEDIHFVTVQENTTCGNLQSKHWPDQITFNNKILNIQLDKVTNLDKDTQETIEPRIALRFTQATNLTYYRALIQYKLLYAILGGCTLGYAAYRKPEIFFNNQTLAGLVGSLTGLFAANLQKNSLKKQEVHANNEKMIGLLGYYNDGVEKTLKLEPQLHEFNIHSYNDNGIENKDYDWETNTKVQEIFPMSEPSWQNLLKHKPKVSATEQIQHARSYVHKNNLPHKSFKINVKKVNVNADE